MDLAKFPRTPLAIALLLALLALSFPAISLVAQEEETTETETRTLTVGVTPSPPFSYRDEAGEWTGISVDLWRDVATELGLGSDFREVTVSEAVDGLGSGDLDLVTAALVTTEEREERMNFSHSFYSSGIGVATTAERRSPVLAFIEALFTPETLLAVGALVLVLFGVGLVMWLAERKTNAEQFGGSAVEGLGNGFWWSAVTMTTVGYGDKAPTTLRGRFVGLVWMFASIVLISGFTGAIASALTVTSLAPEIESFSDLYRARVGVVRDSNAADYLASQGISARRYENTEEGLQAVDGKEIDGFVNDLPVLRFYVSRYHADDVLVLDQSFNPGFYAWGMREGLGLEEDLNRSLLGILGSTRWTEIQRRHLGEGAPR